MIPVWFTDSNNFIAVENKDIVREDIRKAYFGSNEEIGWRSVKTYYEEESHGKLTIDGTVSEWYSENASYNTYAAESNLSNTVDLVVKATKWYFDNHTTEKRRDYDEDGNGYLDGVMLIYGAPDYSAMNNNKKNLWAYCYWVQDTSANSRFNPGANAFFWASYDFMYGSNIVTSHTGLSNYHSGDTSHVNIDTHTFIHEMGHMYGLDDYYDYAGQYLPAGGFSMQDQNVGGHDPFSSFALGWGKAYVPTESMTIHLKPFDATGEMIILSPNWNTYNSAFDEYLILEYYTPNGLNKHDTTYQYNGAYPTGTTEYGIRLWHVDARLNVYTGQVDSSGNPKFTPANTTDPASASNKVALMMNNSYQGTNKDYNLLHLIRNKTTTTFNSKTKFTGSHLFKAGSSFDTTTFNKQFVKSTTLNNGKALGYSFTVSSVLSEYATITITKG